LAECFQIKKAEVLIDYLKTVEHKDVFRDMDSQLQTNYGFTFNLNNGGVVFLPHTFRNDGIVFENKECLEELIRQDWFPINNPGNSLYDTEIERIKSIHMQIDFYRLHLNRVLKLDFEEINRDACQGYLKKIIGRTIRKLTTNTDLIGLIAVFGEVLRREIHGQWVIEKWYGIYNPHYKPRILDKDQRLIFIDDKILGQVKWKVSSADRIFEEEGGIIDMKLRSEHHECTILE
jgi:hypothetical protein